VHEKSLPVDAFSKINLGERAGQASATNATGTKYIRQQMYLDTERAQTDADLRQVERSLLVQGLCGERGGVGNSVFLHQLGEHGDPFSFSHDSHSLDLRHLECLVAPVYLSRTQLVDQPAAQAIITTTMNKVPSCC